MTPPAAALLAGLGFVRKISPGGRGDRRVSSDVRRAPGSRAAPP